MLYIWYRKIYKEKLDYYWYLLIFNMFYKRYYNYMCFYNVFKGICGVDDFFYVNIYIFYFYLFMYEFICIYMLVDK